MIDGEKDKSEIRKSKFERFEGEAVGCVGTIPLKKFSPPRPSGREGLMFPPEHV
jgi:hypothetical protein